MRDIKAIVKRRVKMYKEIDAYEYMNEIMKGLKTGVLLTTQKDGKVNTMSIAWGAIGIEWNKLIFTALVRQSRYTHDMLESGEFTINIPMDKRNKVIAYCGKKSGRDTDKIADMKLTTVDGRVVDVPAIKELPLTLECKVIYKQMQDENAIPAAILNKMYPERDMHTMFYGEVVSAYIVE
jgi:flavin reductase (DIM6/NTAB) family NADH-FMN oxidoreductase RutF